MTITVAVNTIARSDAARRIEQAVLDGIGDRPETELWGVSIYDPQESPGYFITIEGPAGLRWNHRFSEKEGASPETIRDKVEKDISSRTSEG